MIYKYFTYAPYTGSFKTCSLRVCQWGQILFPPKAETREENKADCSNYCPYHQADCFQQLGYEWTYLPAIYLSLLFEEPIDKPDVM